MSKRQHKTTVTDLPFELWYTIISFLDHQFEITSLMETCKCLYQLFSHPIYGKVEYVVFEMRHEVRCAINAIWYNYRPIRPSDIPNNTRLGLRKLRLSIYVRNDIWNTVRTFQMLTHLYMNECNGITTIPILPNLKRLDCTDCSNLTAIPILPNLKRLDCIDCKKLKTIPTLPNLKYLQCSFCRWLEYISSMPNLKHLRCACCSSLRDIGDMPQLKNLYCRHCRWLTTIPKASQLLHLDCSNCRNLTQIQNIQKLKDLDCRGCDKLKDVPNTEWVVGFWEVCIIL